MNASSRPVRNLACGGRAGGSVLALSCARALYAAIDRRSPLASALSEWLCQHAAALALPDSALPAESGQNASGRRGPGAEDWRKLGEAINEAGAYLSAAPGAVSEQWIDRVGRALQLDELAIRVFALALYYRLNGAIEDLVDRLGQAVGGPLQLLADPGLIALMLGADPADIAAALMPSAKLLGSGLLQVGCDGELIVLERLVSVIRRDIAPQADLYGQLLGAIDTDPLPWQDFHHLGGDADIAASLLRAALAGGERGINILLYGPAGTGKTSFASTLAARVGARLRPVGETDDYQGEPSRGSRLASLRLAQRLSVAAGSVLLFDEAEDLFAAQPVVSHRGGGASRVFIHRLLENVAVPVIWTANDIGKLGPAVLRRMTMCLELRLPSLATRTTLWRRIGAAEGVVLHDDDAARLARLVPAAPALAASALRATRLAGGGAETAHRIVEGIFRAVEGGAMPAPEPSAESGYDLALVNADCNLAALTEDLLRPGAPRRISLLLSGPPGAGKTAWVRHLAGRMDMPVLQKRASDLLDPYVGVTERKIADAFAEARDTRAFLVFDEADSLLLDRADAVRGWEVSQVNEMLTWMEEHAFPFACTTNLADRLDRASLRRFLLKLRFGWLSAPQARLAFRQFFALPAPAGLEDLDMLTPADFSLVRRRAALRSDAPEAGMLLTMLAAESQGRVGQRGRIGFG